MDDVDCVPLVSLTGVAGWLVDAGVVNSSLAGLL